jgi:hypothetical protein
MSLRSSTLDARFVKEKVPVYKSKTSVRVISEFDKILTILINPISRMRELAVVERRSNSTAESEEQLAIVKVNGSNSKLQLLQSPPPTLKLGWQLHPKHSFSTPTEKSLAVVPYAKNTTAETLLAVNTRKASVNFTVPTQNDDFKPMMLSMEHVESMIMTESPVEFQPSGAWTSRRRTANNSVEPAISEKPYYISTSFVNQGFSIDCRSAADAVAILSVGLSKIRVLYVADDTVHTNSRICVRDIDVSGDMHRIRDFSSSHSDEERSVQFISINTPWPCKKIEVMVTERSQDFIAIFDVATYSNSIRSSSLSTPTLQKVRSSVPWS